MATDRSQQVAPRANQPRAHGITARFTIPEVVAGFALESVRGPGSIQLEVQGFYTSDDGPKLFELLDQIYGSILRHGCNLAPEQIKSALVSIRGNDVFLLANAPITVRAVVKQGVVAGAPATIDHLADIASLEFPGHELPVEGSLIFIFQQQWRHGLYFDFRDAPTQPGQRHQPLGDVGGLLGSLWGALLHRDRIRMDESVLARMAGLGWFPFTRLPTSLVVDLYRHVELDWDVTPVVQRIRAEVEPSLPAIVDAWGTKAAFAPHLDVFRDAARLFTSGEARAAAALLLPKVEGVLRHIYTGTKDRPRASDLTHELIGRVRANVAGYTALLPERFIAYLETYYYAAFNLRTGDVPPSRHAFSHGVGPDAAMLDPSFALRLLLTLDQLFFCVSRVKDPDDAGVVP